MAESVKILASEISLTTANTISNASLVRVYAPANSLITVANGAGTIGTCTLGGGTTEYFVKQPTDTIASNIAVQAVSVAFT